MGKKIVALIGGSGHLGALIANALLEKPDVEYPSIKPTTVRAYEGL